MGHYRDCLCHTIYDCILYYCALKESDCRKRSAICATRGTRSPGRHAEFVQKDGSRVSIRQHSEFLLLGANIVTQVEINVPFEIIHLVSEFRHFLLQGNPGVTRKRTIIFWPLGLDQAAAMDTVREVANRNRVGIGVIIFLQHVEIFCDNESRAGCPAWKEKDSLSVRWK